MAYTPDRGDIVWLNFIPQADREQMGKRPAIVLSPKKYNEKTNLAVCCPITTSVKGYPFETIIKGKKIHGAVLCDHLKNLDWKARKAKFIEKAQTSVVAECTAKIASLIINH